MANLDDDDLDNLDETEQTAEEKAEEGGGGNNRNFLLAIGLIGGLFLLMVVGLVLFALFYLPQQRKMRAETNAVVMTQNAGTVVFATGQAELAAQMQTPSPTLTPTVTQVPPTATFTSVVVVATNTPTITETVAPAVVDERTLTVAALLTKAATGKTGTAAVTSGAGTGTTPGTAAAPGSTTGTPKAGTGTTTALPTTGFGDGVGLPGLLGLAAVLVIVIVLARRLRFSPGR